MPTNTVVGLLLVAVSLRLPVADDYTFCLLLNRVAAAGMLSQYSDKQIKNGLCMTTKEILDAIVKKNTLKERVCGDAGRFMMTEFKRRFPQHNPKEVIGRC